MIWGSTQTSCTGVVGISVTLFRLTAKRASKIVYLISPSTAKKPYSTGHIYRTYQTYGLVLFSNDRTTYNAGRWHIKPEKILYTTLVP